MAEAMADANAEYERLLRRIRSGSTAHARPDGDDDAVDPVLSEERLPIAVHEIEVAREERKRRGLVHKEVSRQEFAAQLGIDVEDTRHPDSGKSVLEITEATRAYFGDPEDQTYRAFRRQMMLSVDDTEWLKTSNFVGEDIAEEIAYVKRRQSEPSARNSIAGRATNAPR